MPAGFDLDVTNAERQTDMVLTGASVCERGNITAVRMYSRDDGVGNLLRPFAPGPRDLQHTNMVGLYWVSTGTIERAAAAGADHMPAVQRAHLLLQQGHGNIAAINETVEHSFTQRRRGTAPFVR